MHQVYVYMFIGSVDVSHCGWDVTTRNYCPEYGSDTWNCLAWNKACRNTRNTVYHCAREYNNKEKFTEACANEKDCGLGKEPRIRQAVNVSATSTVTCELCFGNRYKDIPSQSSATFWRCPEEQPQFTNGTHLISCNYTSTSDLKSKRQWARCDAEHNYIPEANDTVYDSIGCSNDKDLHCKHVETCPNGEERVENYRCVATHERPNNTTTGLQDPHKPDEQASAEDAYGLNVVHAAVGTVAGILVGVLLGIVVFVLYRNRLKDVPQPDDKELGSRKETEQPTSLRAKDNEECSRHLPSSDVESPAETEQESFKPTLDIESEGHETSHDT